MLHIPQLIIETLRAALASHWALASWLGLLLFGYTWTTKTDGVDSVAATHINTLQTEKMDRDGQIPATGVQQWAQGADVNSAATLPLGSDGNYFNVLGTTTITAISQTAVGGSTVASGTFVGLHFNGILTLTNGAALALPGGANITTYAGLELEFVKVAAGWRCTSPAIASSVPAGVVPVGGIIMWSGTIATIPTSWQLCNGTNGTPDLRDQFVIGAKQDDSGVAKTNASGSLTQSGGSATHPAHANHAAQSHAGANVDAHQTFSKATSGSGTTFVYGPASHTVTQPNDHPALSHDQPSILNPYYALAFIQRIS